MTLNGAIKELENLRDADDMPIYYKPVFNSVIDVISDEVKGSYSKGFEDGSKYLLKIVIEKLKTISRE